MQQYTGSGPLGIAVDYPELTPAAQLQLPAIVASGAGQTTIVGDGTAQNVFSDTFTALNDGEAVEIVLHFRMNNSAGADTPDFVTKLGSTTVDTSTLTTGGNSAYRTFRMFYSKHATAGRGFGFVESVGPNGGTGTAAQNITKNDNDSWANAINGLSVTCDSAIGTTTVVNYFYVVKKIVAGV